MSTTPKLDARKLREDFPIFEQLIHDHPLAYLDTAASAQKPRAVLEAMTRFYETSYANIHRGVYDLGERATEAYEGAREKARAFVNAESTREVVFTHNVTAAINLVAYGWGLDNLGPGDLVVVTEMEHHSNFVPWQYIAGRTGAEFAVIPVDENGELQLDELDAIAARGNVKVRRLRSRLELARHGQPGGAAHRLGARAGRDRRRRRSAGRRRTARSTCRRSGPTSTLSPGTRCAGRPESASSGAAPSTSRRCRRSSSAAT